MALKGKYIKQKTLCESKGFFVFGRYLLSANRFSFLLIEINNNWS